MIRNKILLSTKTKQSITKKVKTLIPLEIFDVQR